MSILSRICRSLANWSSVPASRKCLAVVRLGVEQFEERAVPTVLSVSGGLNYQQQNGLAPSYLVGLANELNGGAWLKTPLTADDDYVRQFSQSIVPVTATSNIQVAEAILAAKSLSTSTLTSAH